MKRAVAATTRARTRRMRAQTSPSTGRRAERRKEKEISMRYNARHFDLSSLKGISDATLEQHFKLYEGYVAQTNALIAKLSELNKDGGVDEKRMPEYSELKRRLGFEYNGMVLHELYFANLRKNGDRAPARGSPFREAIDASWHRPGDRRHHQPVDRDARIRARRRLRPAPRDGRVGARIHSRLRSKGPAEIHRGVFLERGLAGRRIALGEETAGRRGMKGRKGNLVQPPEGAAK
jgi:hypothetical protein